MHVKTALLEMTANTNEVKKMYYKIIYNFWQFFFFEKMVDKKKLSTGIV